jgi:hypothetical protein
VIDRQPQYGAVLFAVVAVNVPIVLIIVFFTAILLSLRRQLGKHNQAARQRHYRPPVTTCVATANQAPLSSTCTTRHSDTVDLDEDNNWDSGNVAVRTADVEMTPVTSQDEEHTQPVKFYIGGSSVDTNSETLTGDHHDSRNSRVV